MLAVIFGAFGSHGLKEMINPDLMAIYETGVKYHFYHALGLILIGLLVKQYPGSNLLKWSGLDDVYGHYYFFREFVCTCPYRY